MKKEAYLLFFLFLTFGLHAQNINLIADDKIMQKLENQKLMNNPDAKHNGSRYQIFQGTSRNDAYSANGNFMSLFPDVPAYVLYEPPNFKVRIGDFRFKFEALAFKQQMLDKGLTAFYIVHDKINVPRPK